MDMKQGLVAAGFAFTAGWADVVCFRGYKAFASLMTGNIIKFGIASFDQTGSKQADELGFYIGIVFSYMLGSTFFQFVKKYFPGHVALVCAPICAFLIEMVDILVPYVADSYVEWLM